MCGWPRHQYAHAWHLARSTNRLLRPRGRRPHRRAAEQRQYLAPFPLMEMHEQPATQTRLGKISKWRGCVRWYREYFTTSKLGLGPVRGQKAIKLGTSKSIRFLSAARQAYVDLRAAHERVPDRATDAN